MKKLKIKKIICTSLILALTAGIISIPFLIPSCSSFSDTDNVNVISKRIIDINNKYEANQSSFLSSSSSQLPKIASTRNNDFNNIFSKIIDNANEALNEFKQLKQRENLNINQRIWVDSFISKWSNIIGNIKSGIIFLGANPIEGKNILSQSSNHIINKVLSACNIFKINPETGNPDSSQVDKKLLKSFVYRIHDAINVISEYEAYLDYGAKIGFEPSSITKKLFLNQTISLFYSDLLSCVGNEPMNISDIFNSSKIKDENDLSSFFKKINNQIKTNSVDNTKRETEALINLDKKIRNFISFYGTRYYFNDSSYGPKAKDVIKISKSNIFNEVERTLNYNNQQYYGLGISNEDLDAKDIGVGFMKIKKELVPSCIESDANKIYEQLLMNNNSVQISPIEIFYEGIDETNKTLLNMNNLIKVAKQIIKGNLDGTILYDEDGIGPKNPTNRQLEGSDFERFNLWLNQENFFWGRETFKSKEDEQSYINRYWYEANGDLERFKSIIIQQGYESNWKDKETINNMKTGTINGNKALAGAVASLQDFVQYKNITDSLFNSNFYPIQDYKISPFEYVVRKDAGVSRYGKRGSKILKYNCDPYYSITKWNLSSIINHDGKMGHHTQLQYWTEYLNKDNDINPGYVFINNAFYDGWASFTESLANELCIYGSDLDQETRMPTNWLEANGVVPKFNDKKVENQTQIMKKLHGGVYYELADGEDNSVTKLTNSIKLANMLQYYGFLNEVQLKNTMSSLDVAIHFNDEKIQSQNIKSGCSLRDVRTFLEKNSALTINDVNSESIKYLVSPSIATGSLIGKSIFSEIFNNVRNKLSTQNIDLLNNKTEMKKIFDLILRNGEIPLSVLKKVIFDKYNFS